MPYHIIDVLKSTLRHDVFVELIPFSYVVAFRNTGRTASSKAQHGADRMPTGNADDQPLQALKQIEYALQIMEFIFLYVNPSGTRLFAAR